MDGLCSCCKHEVESVSHVLWSCPAANDVWLQSGLMLHKWDRFINSFFDLIVYAQTRLSLEDFQFFCCIVFFIWEQRNRVVHEKGLYSPIAVVERALNLHLGYQRQPLMQALASSGALNGGAVLRNEVSWLPPGVGRYKVNWAICLHGTSKAWRCGVLVRDHGGQVMAGYVGRLMAMPRGVAREIGAIMQVLSFAVEMGFLDLILEGSHALPFMASRRGNQEQSVAEMWIEDIVIL